MLEKMTQKVLLAGAPTNFCKQLFVDLGELGYQVELAREASELFSLWDYQCFDLVILGEMMDESNLVVLRKLRQRDSVPIFVIEGQSSEAQRLAALEMGADDVVSQQSPPRELLLRIRNFLHRSLRQQHPGMKIKQKTWSFGDWKLEEGTRMLVNHEGQSVRLTRAEFDLLLALVRAESQPLSKMQLSDAVGRGNLDTSPETIAVLIHRLRKKLGCKDIIQTLSGVGYRLPECELLA